MISGNPHLDELRRDVRNQKILFSWVPEKGAVKWLVG